MHDRKVILSTLWIFAVLNYLYADVFSLFFNPTAQQEAQAITAGSGFAVLVFAILLETAMAMALLSRVLKYRDLSLGTHGSGLALKIAPLVESHKFDTLADQSGEGIVL